MDDALPGTEASDRSEFLGVLAHEVITPLTPILGFATTLLAYWDEFTDEEKQAHVETIRQRAHQIARLMDRFITMERYDAGLVPVAPRPVAVLDMLLAALPGDGSAVSVSCPRGLVVPADPHVVATVLGCFLENALTHGRPPIEILATEVGACVEIRMSDSGPGVPEAFVPLLFRRFQQASNGTARAAQGMGLGLSMAQRAAATIGGDVWYEHHASGGATFGLRLPTASDATGRAAILVSRAATLATQDVSEPEAVRDLIATSCGDARALEAARQRCLRLGFRVPSCRKAARLLALVKAEAFEAA